MHRPSQTASITLLPGFAVGLLCLASTSVGCKRAPAPSTPVVQPDVQTPPASGSMTDGAAMKPPETKPDVSVNAQATADVVHTSAGDLSITPLVHASMLLTFAGKVIYIDPTNDVDLSQQPKADMIFVTDIHQDHLDFDAITAVRKDETTFVVPPAVASQFEDAEAPIVIENGESRELDGLTVEAVPMYNVIRGPESGEVYHEKGRGNGYILTFGTTRMYISGDTECIPEMRGLKNIDLAFVCMNLPYTMPPQEAATCIRAFHPRVIYPYHYRDSNLDELTTALAGSGVEVRLRKWY